MKKKQKCSRKEFMKCYEARIISETMKPRTEEERKRGEEARKEFLEFMKERSGQ